MLNITFNDNVEKYENVKDVKAGEIFKCDYNSGIFMKVDGPHSKSINMRNGNFVSFNENEKVVLLDCELIVNT